MSFRRHLIAFVLVNAALNVANAIWGDAWWAFWPLLVWSIGLAGHYFVYKSKRVDEAWVEERTEDVRSKSYDRAHMDTIEKREKK
jgi:hypothetical protein